MCPGALHSGFSRLTLVLYRKRNGTRPKIGASAATRCTIYNCGGTDGLTPRTKLRLYEIQSSLGAGRERRNRLWMKGRPAA